MATLLAVYIGAEGMVTVVLPFVSPMYAVLVVVCFLSSLVGGEIF